MLTQSGRGFFAVVVAGVAIALGALSSPLRASTRACENDRCLFGSWCADGYAGLGCNMRLGGGCESYLCGIM